MARQSFLASRNKIIETILIREKLELQEWPENRASHTKDVILIKQEVSTGEEIHAQIASDISGKPGGNIEGHASTCSPIHDTSSVDTEHETVKVSSITDFFYDDPNVPYTPLPEHDLEQSPCFSIIAIKQGYFYYRLHPDIKNVHLESIKHHIKYKDPEIHRSELLKFSKLTHD
jgi:hypothetical protein